MTTSRTYRPAVDLPVEGPAGGQQRLEFGAQIVPPQWMRSPLNAALIAQRRKAAESIVV